MKLNPQADGTLQVELSAADRRALNTSELLLRLIKQHEASPVVREQALESSQLLELLLAYYGPKITPITKDQK